LKKVPRPSRAKHETQEQTIEEVRSYLATIDSIGREYLGSFWPPKYINEELKEGFIKAIFQDMEISEEKQAYMASALFMRENEQTHAYRPKENDPATAMIKAQEEAPEEKRSFTDSIERKRPEDIARKVASLDASAPAPGQTLH